MTTKEAIQAMLEGKKVRATNWEKEYYIQFSENAGFIDESLAVTYVTPEEDWEIYEEPKQTVTVEKWLCLDGGFYFTLEGSFDFINNYNSYITKVKLLDTYEVEL